MELSRPIKTVGLATGVLAMVVAGSASAAFAAPHQRNGWNNSRSYEQKINALEAKKDHLEILQDRADQKVGGRRAEIIKAQLEHQQDVIDYRIKALENQRERSEHRYRDRHYPRYRNGNHGHHYGYHSNNRRDEYCDNSSPRYGSTGGFLGFPWWR